MSYKVRNSIVLGVLLLLIVGVGTYVRAFHLPKKQDIIQKEIAKIDEELSNTPSLIHEYNTLSATVSDTRLRWESRSKEIPAERDGVPADATGAIMFVCSNSDKHEDKEVLISKCPSCSEMNYFYWDSGHSQFVCFACTKTVDNAVVKCPECGKAPHKVRTRASAK